MDTTLVLADPHPIFLYGLQQQLEATGGFRVLASCSSGNQAAVEMRRHRPDLLVCDLHLPDKKGLALVRELRQERIPSRTVILTSAMDEEQALEALRLGVEGVVLKEMPFHLVAQCLRKVHAGGRWLEKQSVGRAVEKLLRREEGTRRLAAVLTAREIEIVLMVARGMSNREIADKLGLQEGTVKIHLHNVYKKLGIGNRVDLTLYAQKKGLV